MNFVLFILLLAWGLVAWLAIFMVVPSCMQSMFRHRLWRLRDNIVDQIRGDGLAEPGPFRDLVHEVECAIIAAPEVSPFRIGLLRAVSGNFMRDAKVESFDPENVHPSDRRLAEAYVAEFRAAFFRQLLFGSPSGWILFLLLVVLTLPIALVRSVTRGAAVVTEAKDLTRNELDAGANPERTLALLRGRREPDREGLSICV
jgi:hypothetical protein